MLDCFINSFRQFVVANREGILKFSQENTGRKRIYLRLVINVHATV